MDDDDGDDDGGSILQELYNCETSFVRENIKMKIRASQPRERPVSIKIDAKVTNF